MFYIMYHLDITTKEHNHIRDFSSRLLLLILSKNNVIKSLIIPTKSN